MTLFLGGPLHGHDVVSTGDRFELRWTDEFDGMTHTVVYVRHSYAAGDRDQGGKFRWLMAPEGWSFDSVEDTLHSWLVDRWVYEAPDGDVPPGPIYVG